MIERKDLPGASEFIEVLTLFVVFTEFNKQYNLVGYDDKNKLSGDQNLLKKARTKAIRRFYSDSLDLNFDAFSRYINERKTRIPDQIIKNRFIIASNFLALHYDKKGKFKTVNSEDKNTQDNQSKLPEPTKPAETPAPAPLVPAKPVVPTKPAPAQPKYKTREEVVQELMSQGKITDPSQAVALSSPVTVNGRTFQALISPLGTLPGPGGVRVPIINDQQANSYAMSLLKEYNTLAGVGYQPLNDIAKGNLDPKNIEPLKKLLARIDLAVKNKTSHEQTSTGEPILPQMREPKLSADTENLYKILKRLSGQTLVQSAKDNSSEPVKKNDIKISPRTTETSVTPADTPEAGIKTNRNIPLSDTVNGPEIPNSPITNRNPSFNSNIAKEDTSENTTDPNLVIDTSSLYFKDEKGQKIPGSGTTEGFFEFILDWFKDSEYYNVSNTMTEEEFIKRVSGCKTLKDKTDPNKCWTEFPNFMLGKLSSILGTYRTPDNKIYNTLKKFIPLGVQLNIEMIMNLIEANDPRYANLTESFIGVK